MTTHLHKKDIWKMAALMLGESELRENSKIYRLLDAFYNTVRDDELRQNCWSFALKTVELAAHPQEPQGAYTRQFQLPNDCVFLTPLTLNGDPEKRSIPYLIEADRILTHAEAPLTIRYVSNDVPEGAFDPSFTLALATSLALMVTHNITGKNSYLERLTGQYEKALMRAESANALEAPILYEEPLDIISVR